jgi:hypothetical protein
LPGSARRAYDGIVLNPLLRVTAVRHLRDHVLWLQFTDGLAGEADLAAGLRGRLLEPLRDPGLFARASLEHGTVVWPNGADWASESLHALVRGSINEISRFFGVIVRMLANDHVPLHFDAVYGDYEMSVTIRDGIVTGQFPGRALRMVLEWRELHEAELMENWELLRRGEPARAIAPLI